MGAKNSKITPESSLDCGNEQTHETSSPPVKPQGLLSGPSLSSLNTSSNSIQQKATGPPLHMISPTNKVSPTSVAYADDMKDHRDLSGRRKGHFLVGDKILGNFEGNGEWFPGSISKAYDDLVYDIDYDDGDAEESVPASDIKLRPRGPRTTSVPSLESAAQPPVAITTTVTSPPTTKTHKSSSIVRVQSSSKLLTDSDANNNENTSTPTGFGMNSTHSSSFKQLPPSGKKHGEAKPNLKPVTVKKANAEVEDYGEYDGSLDFVPRVSSKQNVKANMHDDVDDDDDDEFAALDDEDNQRSLTKSVLSGERSDSSAVIKNLYREDSKNNLLTPQYYEDKNSVIEPPSISGPSIVDIENKNEKETKEVEEKEEETSESTDEVTHDVTEEIREKHIEPHQEPKLEEEVVDSVVGNQKIENTTIENKNKIKKKKKQQNPRKEKANPTQKPIPAPVVVSAETSTQAQKQSDFREVWEDDDDLFGMNGMNIQRVDSVESIVGLEEGGAAAQGGGISYYNDDQDQSYGHTSSETGMSYNDSFFNPNEQSHADSFYSASSGHQQQAGPDWGHISQQSAHLYDQVEQEEEQGQEQEYGGEYSSGGPTDSGWSLCYTADGTPYFYSYELQESCWELPTTKKPPVQEQVFQPSQNFIRPHTSTTASTAGGDGRHISRGVVQSKHELAKALNSNKCKSTLHLTNLIEDDDDDAPYDLGLGSMGMMPLKKVSSTSRLKDTSSAEIGLGSGGKDARHAHTSKGMKRPQSMAAMRRKKKDLEF